MTLPLFVNVKSVRREVFRQRCVAVVLTVTALFRIPDCVVATRQPLNLLVEQLFDKTSHVRRGIPSHRRVVVVDTVTALFTTLGINSSPS